MNEGLSLSFDALKDGRLGVSSAYGSFLAEAASQCLYRNDHPDPVLLEVTGDKCVHGNLTWGEFDGRHHGTWADAQEATEYGAYGVAILVALPLTRTSRVQRSAKGTGIDYWLGDGLDERGIFQRTARLEVSGILKGKEVEIAARLREKLVQIKQSDLTTLPGYVVIVSFATPEARLVKATAERR
jgi:hypothetical protein